MRKLLMIIVMMVLVLACGPRSFAQNGSQEAAKAEQMKAAEKSAQQAQNDKMAQVQKQADLSFYRVEYVLREVETGKVTNTRNYVLTVDSTPRGSGSIRVGNKIPLATGKEPIRQIQYQDIGMSIDCTLLSELESDIRIFTTLDVTSLATSEEMKGEPTLPVIRNLRLRATTKAILGKAVPVGSVDDMGTIRRYEVDVTVTRVK
jgi:hypothetical protein